MLICTVFSDTPFLECFCNKLLENGAFPNTGILLKKWFSVTQLSHFSLVYLSRNLFLALTIISYLYWEIIEEYILKFLIHLLVDSLHEYLPLRNAYTESSWRIAAVSEYSQNISHYDQVIKPVYTIEYYCYLQGLNNYKHETYGTCYTRSYIFTGIRLQRSSPIICW